MLNSENFEKGKYKQNKKGIIGLTYYCLTLPMVRLLSSKGQGRKGIHWITLTEHSQMSTFNVSGSQSLSGSLHDFVMAKSATSIIRINGLTY